jgi:peptidoglycan/LPS O-acetylase OafA/YrhL
MVGVLETTAPDSAGSLLLSGDESGTAPGDRPFRPDVEGLRAVAVLLVVLFHSGVSVLSGGFVGVDVFFVISGFVITGVLLRERSSSGGTSILAFYGRRCRRIIPAATLVIIVTVVAAFYFLGIGGGIPTASDARWAAVFLANFHFIATGTNYLASQAPPSPLQNFWSLAVEEQFYVIYPTLFLLVASAKALTFRVRMTIGLVAVIVGSLAYSIVDTNNNPVAAFFSPFTRAWELALGALVAIATPWLLKIPTHLAALATWVGLGAIAVAATTFTSQTLYPGAYSMLPVIGAALIIAGGMRAPTFGAEALLKLAVFRWLGRLSYSLYLWHWPILIIAAEYAGKTTLSVKDNLGWDLVALVISVLTYFLIENPIRHNRFLKRSRRASVGLGLALIGLTLVVIAVQSNLAVGSSDGGAAGASEVGSSSNVSLRQVLADVAESNKMQTIPPGLVPHLSQLVSVPDGYIGFPPGPCIPANFSSRVQGRCVYGDKKASRTMLLYGDSHAGMWFQAIDNIAKSAHWKLVVLFKPGCPASDLSSPPPGTLVGRWPACDKWHKFAVRRIKSIDPDLLIISQTAKYRDAEGKHYSHEQLRVAFTHLLQEVRTPGTTTVVIGNPVEPHVDGQDCLSRHSDDIQICSGPPDPGFSSFNGIEQAVAVKEGARFISVVPWFCTHTCSSVIQHYEVYLRNDHITEAYTLFLQGVLAKALHLQPS